MYKESVVVPLTDFHIVRKQGDTETIICSTNTFRTAEEYVAYYAKQKKGTIALRWNVRIS